MSHLIGREFINNSRSNYQIWGQLSSFGSWTNPRASRTGFATLFHDYSRSSGLPKLLVYDLPSISSLLRWDKAKVRMQYGSKSIASQRLHLVTLIRTIGPNLVAAFSSLSLGASKDYSDPSCLCRNAGLLECFRKSRDCRLQERYCAWQERYCAWQEALTLSEGD